MKNDDLINKEIVKINCKIVDRRGVRIEVFPGVMNFLVENSNEGLNLMSYLKNDLTKIFGEHNKTFRGEFFNYVWNVDFDGESFQIFTAKGKGTEYLIVAKYDDDKSEVCINFLKKLKSLLDKL